MGFHVEQVGDPTEWTPKFCANAVGAASWGGKHVSDLSAEDLVAMLDFCREEAWRQGWNSSIYGRVDLEYNLFDEELLGGYPYAEWKRSYRRGVDERVVHPVHGDEAKARSAALCGRS